MKRRKTTKSENLKTGHGITIPLSAIHTQQSAGIGEFLDLIPLIDWCHHVGFEVIQLLPINDSGDDPSPYNPVSSCALSPMYISLSSLPHISDLLKQKLQALQESDRLTHIPFATVRQEKLNWLRQYYQERGEAFVSSTAYEHFLSQNGWVNAYALYKDEKEAPFHVFLQFLCFEQMKQVKAHAKKRKVFIMGDIPILISRTSVDVLNYPQFFHVHLFAGAPPDAYNEEGQNWAFPIYNWEAMKADGYSWWKTRLKVATQLYDLYRIDHIVGIFRIWAIPEGKSPKEGHFWPEDPSLWIEQGVERLLMMLHTSPMLPVGEDLGTVPPEVRLEMANLGICGTKVIRWERNWHSDRTFIPYHEYPFLSLTTVSTHDSETLALWWQHQIEEAHTFAHFKNWTYTPTLTEDQRFEILRDSHHTPTLLHINLLQEYLALFPELVWPNPEDERINIPGTLHPHNWVNRYRPSLEELAAHNQLAEKIRSILS